MFIIKINLEIFETKTELFNCMIFAYVRVGTECKQNNEVTIRPSRSIQYGINVFSFNVFHLNFDVQFVHM